MGLFKIIEESSLAAGVRRIVAVTGQKSVEYSQEQSNVLQKVQSQLNCATNDITSRIDQLILQKKSLEKELKVNKKADVGLNVKTLIKDSYLVRKHSIVIKTINAKSLDELKDIGDSLLDVLKSGVGILGAEGEKPSVVIVVTQDLVKLGIKAGDLAKDIGALMGGGGGGKPHLATAGGLDSVKLKKAMGKSLDIIKELIEGKS